MNRSHWKECPVPEPSAIDGVLRAIVEAMEAREAAEPDLPEWEANAIDVDYSTVGPTAVEVA
jgi:hypothetical protein